jgi:hypothetical protein
MKCFVPQMGFPNAYAPSSSSSVVVNKLEYFVSQMAFGNAYVPLSSSSSYQQMEFGNANISSLGLCLKLLALGFRVFFLNGKISDSKFKEYFKNENLPILGPNSTFIRTSSSNFKLK